MNMKDKTFLYWLHKRLAGKAHVEGINLDHMIKLRAIIMMTPDDQNTEPLDPNPTEFLELQKTLDWSLSEMPEQPNHEEGPLTLKALQAAGTDLTEMTKPAEAKAEAKAKDQ